MDDKGNRMLRILVVLIAIAAPHAQAGEPLPFDQYTAEIDRLAAKEGIPVSVTEGEDAQAFWQELYRDELTASPQEAWSEAKMVLFPSLFDLEVMLGLKDPKQPVF